MPLTREQRRKRLRNRIRKVIKGTEVRPRLSVFRSNRFIYAQLIDDVSGSTLVAATSSDKEMSSTEMANKVVAAEQTGKLLAQRATAKGIKVVVFDRGGHLYHGRVKALAEGARQGGLAF